MAEKALVGWRESCTCSLSTESADLEAEDRNKENGMVDNDNEESNCTSLE